MQEENDRNDVITTVPPVTDMVAISGNKSPKSFVEKSLRAYCVRIQARPVSIACFYLLLVGLLIGVLYKPLIVDMNFTAYVHADSSARRNHDAYESALSGRVSSGGGGLNLGKLFDVLMASMNVSTEVNNSKNNTVSTEEEGNTTPPTAQTTSIDSAAISFIYVPRHSHVLDWKVLEEIRDFESQLRALDGWKRLCWGESAIESLRYQCDPGQSLMAYVWPTVTHGSRSYHKHMYKFDGLGRDRLALEAVLPFLQTSQSPAHSPRNLFPSDALPLNIAGGGNVKGFAPSALRTNFKFNIRKNAMFSISQENQLKAFILEEVHPYFSKTRLEHVEVWLYGNYIDLHERWSTLISDCLWVLGSLSFLIIYMSVNTGSIILSTLSFLIIFMSLPLGYVLLPGRETSVTSFFAMFLMLGIGADDAFVFLNYWQQSRSVESRMDERLAWMLTHAGKGCLATSIATSASFFANLANGLKPLREFGFFIGACVMSAYVVIMLFFPSVAVVLERRCCQKTVATCPEPNRDQISSRSSPRGQVWTQWFMALFVRALSRCPTCLLLVTFLIVFACIIIMIVYTVQLDLTVPEVFPDGHNQIESKRWKKQFSSVSSGSASDHNISSPGAACTLGAHAADECIFYWCDRPAAVSSLNGTCWQFYGMANDSGRELQNCSGATINTRLVSRRLPSSAEWMHMWTGIQNALGAELNFSGYRPHLLEAPLVYEDWELGALDTEHVYDTGNLTFTKVGKTADACEVDVQCSLVGEPCDMPGWRKIGNLRTDVPVVLRQDSSVITPANQTGIGETNMSSADSIALLLGSAFGTSIEVVWGVLPARSTPLLGETSIFYEEDPRFEPTDPWAQRSMLSMCSMAPERFDIQSVDCWLRTFRGWLLQSGYRFPSRNFNAQVDQWKREQSPGSTGFKGGRLPATSISFTVRLVGSGQDVLEYRTLWDAFIRDCNRHAPLTANRAFHTSTAWRDAETKAILVSSAIETVAVVAGSAFLCMLISTYNLLLSLVVVCMVLGVVICLMFFMLVVMQWTLGPIELVSLIVFVGYAVTYPLHVAHTFCDIDADHVGPDETLMRSLAGLPGVNDDESPNFALTSAQSRRLRVTIAICRIGGAILSSAISTVGASCFLLFCTITVFHQLGTVLIAVTLLSMCSAMVVLPALLLKTDLGCARCCCHLSQTPKRSAEADTPTGPESNFASLQ